MPRRKELISAIYESCFSQVSDKFLESTVKEIAKRTGTQIVMIHRLLTFKEYIDLKYNEGCPHVQLIDKRNKTDNGSDEDSPDISRKSISIGSQQKDVEYLFIKACYSTIQHDTLAKYTAAPISSFPANSPHIKAISESQYQTVQKNKWIQSVYPSFKSYIGIRLDENDTPIGLISVMDTKPLSSHQVDVIKDILKAIQTRTKNEIERIRQHDHLIMMKNEALRDAESKIKFLAEMSHEIRTPMSAVVALTDLMLQERQYLKGEHIEHLDVIQTSGNHLLTVVNDILDISKINHDPKFKLEVRRFNIRKCVKDALNMARHQASMAQNNKVFYVVECPPDLNQNIPLNQLVQQLNERNLIPQNKEKMVLPLILKIDPTLPLYLMGDSMRLTQILLNLCSNAVKFTKSGAIQVEIGKSQGTPGESQYKERYEAIVDSAYTRISTKGRKDLNDSFTTDYKGPSLINLLPLDIQDYHYQKQVNSEAQMNSSEPKIMLEISVTDSGIGISPDRLPHLFKSFSQLDISTARRYGGTGLGLAICSMLVNRMSGSLWVESEEGVGSRFALTLPILEGTDIPSTPSPSHSSVSEGSLNECMSSIDLSEPHPNPPVENNTTQILSKPKPILHEDSFYPLKILLAEDNFVYQKITMAVLKRLGYQDVIIAGNGREVLELMRLHKFDVIFMDLYMPEMDGLETTKYILSERKNKRSPEQNGLLNLEDVYIIASTASAVRKDRQVCIEAGMNDYLKKPFSITEMHAALKNCIKRKEKLKEKSTNVFD